GGAGTLLIDDSTVSSVGTLELQGGIITPEPLILKTSNVTSLRNVSGNNTVTGGVKIDPAVPVEVVGSSQLALSGQISDSSPNGGLNKLGPGTLVLLGANTYTGPTAVAAGTLLIRNNAALGSTQAGTTVQAGATLAGFGNLTVSEPVRLVGQSG